MWFSRPGNSLQFIGKLGFPNSARHHNMHVHDLSGWSSRFIYCETDWWACLPSDRRSAGDRPQAPSDRPRQFTVGLSHSAVIDFEATSSASAAGSPGSVSPDGQAGQSLGLPIGLGIAGLLALGVAVGVLVLRLRKMNDHGTPSCSDLHGGLALSLAADDEPELTQSTTVSLTHCDGLFTETDALAGPTLSVIDGEENPGLGFEPY
jgi:hypothetical protein